MNLNLFNAILPYDKIKHGSVVALYGAGLNGNVIYNTVQQNQYCHIICAFDKNYLSVDFPVDVLAPEKINAVEFDYLLITISDYKIQDAVYRMLLEMGVDKDKLVRVENLTLPMDSRKCEFMERDDDGGNVLKFAFVLNAGLGDSIITLLPIQSFKQLVPDSTIDLFVKSSVQAKYLAKMPFIDNVYQCVVSDYSELVSKYDVIMTACWIPTAFSLKSININKVRRFSELLYQYYVDLMQIASKIVRSTEPYMTNTLDFMRIMGLKKLDQWNPNGILPYTNKTTLNLPVDERCNKIIGNNKLKKKQYITICNTVDKSAERSAKKWPVEYYTELCRKIKEKYPFYKIVRIGDDGSEKINNIDVDLTEKTNLDELFILLKNSILFIGSEGGLVHIHHFMGGKSCCLFGPTDIEIYGYDENINLRCSDYPRCQNGCEAVYNYTICLQSCCLLNMPDEETIKYAKCMSALKPTDVFDKISGYLDDIQDELL